LGGPMGSGRQWWPWVHVDDVVGIARAALADDRYQGAVNVTAPNAARQRDVAKALGRVVHRPAVVPAPAFALKLLLGGFAEELLGSRHMLPARATELGYAFRQPELEPALRDLVA
jgi:NAD dependent epimerase/dehydratase family enzyme